MKKVKINILKSGYYIKNDRNNIVRKKSADKKSYAGFALIEHPQLGYMLFDTGFSRYYENAIQEYPYCLCSKYMKVVLDAENNTLFQLSMLGINPDEIKYVIISHFHPEHIAGLKHFENAKFVCSRRAYENIKDLIGLRALVKGFVPELLPDDFEKRLIYADDYSKCAELDILGGCYDIFSDSSVIVVPLNGHVKGLIGILVETEQGRKFLISDACPSSNVFEEKNYPITEILLTVEKKKSYIVTLNKIRKYHFANPDVEIIPSHCPVYWLKNN